MSKMGEIAMTIEELRNAAAAITDAANYLAELFSSNAAAEQSKPKAPAKNLRSNWSRYEQFLQRNPVPVTRRMYVSCFRNMEPASSRRWILQIMKRCFVMRR